MLQLVDTKKKSPPVFLAGEQVWFDIPDYGSGMGRVAGFYTHTDGTNFYAVAPNNPRVTEKYRYICIILPEDELISAPF